jgi:glycosyltransferase involved in cell wall biosynthesis
VTVTDDARENHFRWLPPLSRSGTKVVSIHHGIDTRRFVAPHNGNAGHLREKFGIPPEAFLIGFLGRFMEQKGFLYLIEALERLLADGSINRPVHLLAVGSGDCLVNYRWELDRYPRARAAITFTEFVADVSPVLAEIDLLAMPSLWEACGLLAMEAMCAGVPVLGTDCIGLREVLRGTPSIVVRAADAESLAEGLKQAVNHPWHDAARDFAGEARRRFDVVPAAMKLRDLFDEFP